MKKFPAVNCTEDPFEPPMNEYGMYNFNSTLGREKSFGTNVTYSYVTSAPLFVRILLDQTTCLFDPGLTNPRSSSGAPFQAGDTLPTG